MSRKKGLVLNTFWIINSTIVGFLRSIVLIPILLQFLSLELYNFWVVLMSALAIIVYVFSGFQRFSANEYNLQYYIDEKKAIYTLGSGFKFFVAIAIVLVSLSGLAIFSDRLSSVFGTTAGVVRQFRLHYCLLFIVIVSMVNSLTNYIATSIEPLGKYYVNSRYFALYNTIEITFWVSVLFVVKSFFWVFLLFLVLFGVFNLAFILSLFRKYKVSIEILKSGTLKDGAILFKRSVFFLVNNFAEKVSTDGLNFIVSIWYHGLNALPALQSVRTMSNVFVTGSNALSSTFSFEMQRMTAQEKDQKLVHIFHFLWLVIGALANIGALAIYPFLVSIYKLWVNDKVEITEPFFYTIFAMSLMVVYGTVVVLYMKVVNEVKKLFAFTVVKSLLLLALLFFLPKDIFYVAVGLYIVELIFNLFFLNRMLIQRFDKQKELRIRKRIFWSMLPFILVSFYFMLGYRIPGSEWLKTGIMLLAVGSIYLYQVLNEKNLILQELWQTAQNRLPFLRKR